MYSVMIVDDEPAAVRYLTALVEKKCPGYYVAETANDGYEALKKLEEYSPDVILFDICMPGLDGLEMAAEIRRRNMNVIMVVVSGYSDFEYARKAIKYDATDYLLKPVSIDSVEKLFAGLTTKLAELYYKERTNLLKRLDSNDCVSEERLKRYFGNQKFYLALVRFGGIPNRFSAMNSHEIFSDIHEMMISYGRDEKETLSICPEELVFGESFEQIIEKQIQRSSFGDMFHTSILLKNPVSYREIASTANQMYQILDNNLILGKCNLVYLEDYKMDTQRLGEDEQFIFNEFRHHSKAKDYNGMQQDIRNILYLWNERARPLLWIERRIRDMSLILSGVGEQPEMDKDYMEKEYAMEEIFLTSQNIEQLSAGVEEILFKGKYEELDVGGDKLDTGDFIGKICSYAEEHLDRNITLNEMGKEFGVSQAYLGKLFRKYKEMSFNSYFTQLKMEKAKEIMRNRPDVLMKDIAEWLGYKDQFYFSRVFRSYMGCAPSDYMETQKKK